MDGSNNDDWVNQFLQGNDDYTPFSCSEHGRVLIRNETLQGERPPCPTCGVPLFTVNEVKRMPAPKEQPKPEAEKPPKKAPKQPKTRELRKERIQRLRTIRKHLED